MEITSHLRFTHDSIGVGEDGPTHQPIEQLVALRAVPGLVTIRPADANEVAEAWRVALQFRHEPVALVLTRQALPTLDRTRYASAAGLARGAYVLADAPGALPEVMLLATGSEVALCVAAHEQLVKEGIRSRVVSMPSWELFYTTSVVPRRGAPPRSPRACPWSMLDAGMCSYIVPGAAPRACARSAPRPLAELRRVRLPARKRVARPGRARPGGRAILARPTRRLRAEADWRRHCARRPRRGRLGPLRAARDYPDRRKRWPRGPGRGRRGV